MEPTAWAEPSTTQYGLIHSRITIQLLVHMWWRRLGNTLAKHFNNGISFIACVYCASGILWKRKISKARWVSIGKIF